MTIGSSDIAVLLGGQWAPPYADSSPWSVLRRCQGKPFMGGDTAAQGLGRDFEAGLLLHLGAKLGMMPLPGPALDEAPVSIAYYAHARPDGGLWTREAGAAPAVAAAAEIKVIQRFGREWGESGTGECAPYYRPQCWWHMAGLDVPVCYLLAMSRESGERRIYRIERDMRAEELALAFAKQWYDRHVIAGEPLRYDFTIHARRSLDELYPPSDWPDRPNAYPTDELATLYRMACALSAKKKEAKEALDRVNDVLRQRLGPAGRLVNSKGKVLVGYGDNHPKDYVDLEALRLEAPALVARHTTKREPKTPRAIRLYAGKETT